MVKVDSLINKFGHIPDGLTRSVNRFLKILTFSPIETISRRSVLALSIERGIVSFTYGSILFSGIKVKATGNFNYDEGRFPSPDELATTATMVVSQVKAGPDVHLIIPKAWTVLRIAEFPVTVKENLQNVVSFEMDRLTPFNAEDIFYDYRVIKEDGNRLFLQIVAAKRDTVAPYIEALRENGINVTRVTTGMTAMAALNHYSGRKGYTIFLDIGKDSYEAGLYDGSVVVDHASGFFKNEDDRAKVDKIFEELQPLFIKAQSIATTDVLLLLRDGSLKELLKTRISYPLRILGETDIKLRLPPGKDVSYVALGGLVESLRFEGLNLLSYGKREKEKIPFLFTIILILAIIALATVYFITPLRVEERRLHVIEEQIAQKKVEAKKVEALKKEVEDLRDEIASINNFKEDRTSTLAVLKEMTLTLPRNTWLTRFRVTETNVDIEGYAASATELLPGLEASKYFRKAEFSSPTFRDARMNSDRFIIKMEIETDKKAEVKVEKK